MNKRHAFMAARRLHPRAEEFFSPAVFTVDGGVLLVLGSNKAHQQCLVVHSAGDLYRLGGLCTQALAQQGRPAQTVSVDAMMLKTFHKMTFSADREMRALLARFPDKLRGELPLDQTGNMMTFLEDLLAAAGYEAEDRRPPLKIVIAGEEVKGADVRE